MSDNIKKEYEAMLSKRKAMRQDLVIYGTVLSAASQIEIRKALACLDNDIREMREEVEFMEFDNLIRNAWKGDSNE